MTLDLLLRESRGVDLATAGVELRSNGDGAPTFFGHAAVFDKRTAIGNPLTWGFYEEVASSAFTKTLDEGDARFLVDHDTAKVVSRVSAGTLRLDTDGVGLPVDSDLNLAKSYVADLVENLRDKSITGMSFGFSVVKDEWRTEQVETNDGQTVDVEVRRLLEVRLYEVSAVTFPAYEDTDAGLRGAASGEIRDVAQALLRRGDASAVEKRAAFLPDLLSFPALRDLSQAGEPGETTRAATPPGVARLTRREQDLAARYLLPRK